MNPCLVSAKVDNFSTVIHNVVRLNWKSLFLLFIFSSSLVLPMQFEPETELLNAWISDGEYYDRQLGFSAELRMYGNFTLNKGEYVEFFICDDGNLTRWLDGDSFQVYDYQEVYDFYAFDFITPYNDMWHLIFSNVNLTSTGTRQITGYLTVELSPSLTQPTIPEVVMQTYILGAVIGVSAVIVIIVLILRRR